MRQCSSTVWLLCAWVLWSAVPAGARPTFLIIAAFEAKAECEKLAQLKRAERIEGAQFMCLPGETDPRPRFKE